MHPQVFANYECVLLPNEPPFDVDMEVVTRFLDGGGRIVNFVTSQTQCIVAKDWEDVETHFQKFPSLLDHYCAMRVGIVTYEWLHRSVECRRIRDHLEFPLDPYTFEQWQKMSRTGSLEWNSDDCPKPLSPRTFVDLHLKYSMHFKRLLEDIPRE